MGGGQEGGGREGGDWQGEGKGREGVYATLGMKYLVHQVVFHYVCDVIVQPDQINMAVLSWYLVKSDSSDNADNYSCSSVPGVKSHHVLLVTLYYVEYIYYYNIVK